MAHNPDIQAKAQAEIDSVTSGIRLPDFTDRDGGALPYVEAMLTEAMRWIPVAPLGTNKTWLDSKAALMASPGVPHRAINDDEYNGYLIPAGKNSSHEYLNRKERNKERKLTVNSLLGATITSNTW